MSEALAPNLNINPTPLTADEERMQATASKLVEELDTRGGDLTVADRISVMKTVMEAASTADVDPVDLLEGVAGASRNDRSAEGLRAAAAQLRRAEILGKAAVGGEAPEARRRKWVQHRIARRLHLASRS